MVKKRKEEKPQKQSKIGVFLKIFRYIKEKTRELQNRTKQKKRRKNIRRTAESQIRSRNRSTREKV